MCKFQYSTEEFALLRVIAAILFSKDIRCTGQAQMSRISGDAKMGFAPLMFKRQPKLSQGFPAGEWNPNGKNLVGEIGPTLICHGYLARA